MKPEQRLTPQLGLLGSGRPLRAGCLQGLLVRMELPGTPSPGCHRRATALPGRGGTAPAGLAGDTHWLGTPSDRPTPQQGPSCPGQRGEPRHPYSDTVPVPVRPGNLPCCVIAGYWVYKNTLSEWLKHPPTHALTRMTH